MASPNLETTNLHAALGGMSLQSASPGNGTSPETQSALTLQRDTPPTTQTQSGLLTEKAIPTNGSTNSIASPNHQDCVKSNATMPTSRSAVSDTAAPPRKKFVYDPNSMLLPHERLAQQRAAQPQPVNNSNPLSRQPPAQPMQPPQPHAMPQHQAPPPAYPSNSAGYGQTSTSQQMGMPTRAAPPLPPPTNSRPPAQAKPDILFQNRNQPWTDPDAVDPLQSRPPGTANQPLSDEDSEVEEGPDGRVKVSRGKKRVRSEGTASIAGSTSHAEGQGGVTAARITKNAGPALLSDWEVVETLGTGTFGRVLLVRLRPNYRPLPYHPIFPKLQQPRDPNGPTPQETAEIDSQLPHYAMKVLNKAEIVRLKQVEHINSERAILERVRHPFLVELYGTYQDHLNVYMLLSYIPGGELFSHLRRAGRFTADVTRFYLASIILAIDYLHTQDIIYRDLKPENLLLDRDGYLRIADFGFAKIVEDRTFTLCGTPEYLAPEIVLSKGHGKAVDWWALGILCFEMLCGYPPFFDDHPLGIYEKIIANRVAFPSHVDPFAKDLIRRLLTADRSKRLGNLRGGAKDVMAHRWFTGVDWDILASKKIGAPIIPHVASRGDSQNFQRYAPPLPQELPGILGIPQGALPDPYKHLFQDFVFPST
ncbi:hypothetical protein QFC20_002910 [Naganishia adeliensis]|uniref:Uncharacterized protein n=1 Tax=Naganishia adeliensis TaxID=92952 RepID=A0ACC2WHE6_9TREE|nr:hypothetical protein QFC20_002910 [Naganishia adeliensis]